jgi:hypothetical protein
MCHWSHLGLSWPYPLSSCNLVTEFIVTAIDQLETYQETNTNQAASGLRHFVASTMATSCELCQCQGCTSHEWRTMVAKTRCQYWQPNYYTTEPDWLQSQWTARDSRDTNTINNLSYLFLPPRTSCWSNFLPFLAICDSPAIVLVLSRAHRQIMCWHSKAFRSSCTPCLPECQVGSANRCYRTDTVLPRLTDTLVL